MPCCQNFVKTLIHQVSWVFGFFLEVWSRKCFVLIGKLCSVYWMFSLKSHSQQASSAWLPIVHVSRGNGLPNRRHQSSRWTHSLLQTRERQLGHLRLSAMWDQLWAHPPMSADCRTRTNGETVAFLYVSITSDHPEDEFVELLEELLAVAKTHGVVLSPQEEFHLSLSQTVVLRHHWIQPFMQSLKKGLLNCRRFALTVFVFWNRTEQWILFF